MAKINAILRRCAYICLFCDILYFNKNFKLNPEITDRPFGYPIWYLVGLIGLEIVFFLMKKIKVKETEIWKPITILGIIIYGIIILDNLIYFVRQIIS
jgi:hypothetical protein